MAGPPSPSPPGPSPAPPPAPLAASQLQCSPPSLCWAFESWRKRLTEMISVDADLQPTQIFSGERDSPPSLCWAFENFEVVLFEVGERD
ncbi:hypothetical protein COP2_011603 [Malus domestica]